MTALSQFADAWWTAFEAPGQEFTEKGRRTERTYVFGDHAYLVDSRKGPNVYLRCRSYRPKATSPSCYGRAILNIDNRQVRLRFGLLMVGRVQSWRPYKT
jgi:hypothetical protein